MAFISAMNILSTVTVTNGIRLRETNLAAITMGSKNHIICIPAKEHMKTVKSIRYFGTRKRLFISSPAIKRFLRNAPTMFMAVPSGQIHPQKNLPKTSVNTIKTIAEPIPERMVLSLIDVINIIKGSNLKIDSGEMKPLKGYVVDHNT